MAEREGGHAVNAEVYRPYYQDGQMYWTEYGFGLVRPEGNMPSDGAYQRNYRWNEKNLLSESSDSTYTVYYRYGADGQRAMKYVANSGRSTLYYNKMWQTSDVSADWVQGKHIYVGEDRIATKYSSADSVNTQAEATRVYYYHTDHLGSAQVVTNYQGEIHERLEYTPYGELWINWQNVFDAPEDVTPFRFTGKELDAETGLYYYGARYLDPKTSRWMSADPALSDYLPSAPVNDEAKKRNQSLPGQGGVFNYVNLHVYHYAGNNPVVYRDPDGNVNVPIFAAYLKDAGTWARENLGNKLNNPTIGAEGCAVAAMADLAYTVGSKLNPTDINKSYVNAEGNVDWSGVASALGLKDLGSTNRSFTKAQFDKQEASKDQYHTVAKVNVNGGPHWFGVKDVVTVGGRDYISIAGTSSKDSKGLEFDIGDRGKQGWIRSGDDILVPVDQVKQYRQFTKPSSE